MRYMISLASLLTAWKCLTASDEVYEHILCCICPVAMSKPGLCYNAVNNSIEDRVRDWVVGMPANAFLFPRLMTAAPTCIT